MIETGKSEAVRAFEEFLRMGEEPVNKTDEFLFLYGMYIRADPSDRQIIQKFYLQEISENLEEDQAS